MSKMRKTHRLRDRAIKRHNNFSATRNKRQNSGHLHGVFSEDRIVEKRAPENGLKILSKSPKEKATSNATNLQRSRNFA